MIIAHIHIPRTAGANLGVSLLMHFKAHYLGYSIERYGEPNTPNNPGEDHFIALAKRIRKAEKEHENIYIQGHIPYGIHRYIESPVKYITVVRDPIERVWSRYNAYLSAQQYRIHQNWKRQYDLKFERIIEAGELELCNDQTRMIIGTCRKTITDTDADIAMKMLFEEYAWVGTTQDFWKSGKQLSKAVGIPNIVFNRAMINKIPFTIGRRPSEECKTLIIKHNMQDRKVYEYVKDRKSGTLSDIVIGTIPETIVKVDLNKLMKE